MMAQRFSKASITAIEPDLDSIDEAKLNFSNSPFSDRIMAIHCPLQSFGTLEKYDLIICNPPYYDGSYISEDPDRNRARHTEELRVDELYLLAEDLLAEDGRINVIVPFTEETEHIERAFDNDLFVNDILHTLREDGSKKRTLISFGKKEVEPDVSEMLVKDANNRYSDQYIEMTMEFYSKDLRT
jgi:tRNA1Val (adenine37-N6)-methyltransferase